jgi:hypothetical protein
MSDPKPEYVVDVVELALDELEHELAGRAARAILEHRPEWAAIYRIQREAVISLRALAKGKS